MTYSKHIDKICAVVMILAILLTVLFMNGEAFGMVADDSVTYEYENTLFDDSYVHSINIEVDDWDAFLENATSEEYVNANVTIDGETVKNVGLRAKGNTSLSTVAQLGSDRYSLKIEFDCYDSSANYKGLDKLCLNNLIQDYTMMKDYVTYKLMNEFGVASPLVSYCYVTINGEDWGLYLAVEAVEDSFLMRNYGMNYGDLYKPDSMSMGGGRGNGRDFDMDDFDFEAFDKGEGSGKSDENGEKTEGMPEGGTQDNQEKENSDSSSSRPQAPGGFGGFGGGNMPTPGEGFNFGNSEGSSESREGRPDFSGSFDGNFSPDSGSFSPEGGGPGGFGGGFGGFGMGSSEVKLQYSDDEIDSYSTIFENAKTKVTQKDKKRLIRSLKNLSEGIEETDSDKIESAVDIEAVMRYMVVHNFVVNGDSYTGAMVHNYYLYEEDGRLSMIPWDYNLAYGTFQGQDATSVVNDPIDTPLSITEGSNDRPMFSWITSSEEYTEAYHEYYEEFLEQFYESGYISELIGNTYNMIRDYVEKDPTKFCTLEEFETAVETMLQFVEYRCQSIAGQLEGTIPSTDSGQSENSEALIDASGLNLNDMGSMSAMTGDGDNKGFPSFGGDMPAAPDAS